VVVQSNTDLTGPAWECRQLHELEITAKLVYYGVRLIKYVETLAPPP
jgi:hypothetical protein